jgi:hypothetical protein
MASRNGSGLVPVSPGGFLVRLANHVAWLAIKDNEKPPVLTILGTSPPLSGPGTDTSPAFME